MPNWCNNSVTFKHSDPAEIKRLEQAFMRGELMQEFHPIPEDLNITAGTVGAPDSPEQIDLAAKEKANLEKHGFANWYDWSVANWGTKWDVGNEDGISSVDESSISVYFDSAWAPPIGFYEHMTEELGWNVEAYYYEPGMSFVGKWTEGEDEEYAIEGDSKWVVENIPAELDEMFQISANMETWEEEANEETETDNEENK